MNTANTWLITGAIVSGLAVIFGAFGAHGLEGRVSPDRLNTFEIAVRYQMYHGLALLVLYIVQDKLSSPLINYAGYSFLVGVLIFSGSLYLLVLTDTSWFGAITPLGGLFMILGWLILIYAGITLR